MSSSVSSSNRSSSVTAPRPFPRPLSAFITGIDWVATASSIPSKSSSSSDHPVDDCIATGSDIGTGDLDLDFDGPATGLFTSDSDCTGSLTGLECRSLGPLWDEYGKSFFRVGGGRSGLWRDEKNSDRCDGRCTILRGLSGLESVVVLMAIPTLGIADR